MTPTSCSPTCTSSLSIATSASTPTGTYSLTVTGMPLGKTTIVNLVVNVLPQQTLTVNKTGSGTVTSSPAGISCGSTCSAPFDFGTSVTLSATASSGSLFAGWNGQGCSGTGTCTVSMTRARKVKATFNDSQLPQLTLGLNEAIFHQEDTLILTVVVSPGEKTWRVDAYVAIQLPNGSRLFMQADGSFTPEMQPIMRDWTVASFNAEVFRFTFSGQELAGPYTWLATFTESGTSNIIGETAEAPCTFEP